MSRSIRASVCCALLIAVAAPAEARIWKDSTGLYTLDADLVGFDRDTVVLQRQNKELGSIAIAQLCPEDQEYLKSKEAQEIHSKNLETNQTWTLASGMQVLGKVVNYDQREVTVQRRRGRIYVGDTLYNNLPQIYQQMLLKVIAHEEAIPMPDRSALDLWVRSLRGQPKTFNLEGVVLELENGNEYAVPFFLFADKDQGLLKSGWEAWLQGQGGAQPPANAIAATNPATPPAGNPPAGSNPAAAPPAPNPPGAANPPAGANATNADANAANAAIAKLNALGNVNPLGNLSPEARAEAQANMQAEQASSNQNYAEDDHSLHLQSLAATYQQDQQVNRQIAMMNLNMQAIQSGLTSAWEVTLYPVAGNPYPPRWVVTMGRNSEIATQLAVRQNPGFAPGPVRRISN
ncbi:MAG: SHD1 domain-containing protein [Rubripirellula sp.]